MSATATLFIPLSIPRPDLCAQGHGIFLALAGLSKEPLTYCPEQWSRHVLRRQLRRSKPLHYLRQGHRRSSEQTTRRRRRGHGHGYGEEGEA